MTKTKCVDGYTVASKRLGRTGNSTVSVGTSYCVDGVVYHAANLSHVRSTRNGWGNFRTVTLRDASGRQIEIADTVLSRTAYRAGGSHDLGIIAARRGSIGDDCWISLACGCQVVRSRGELWAGALDSNVCDEHTDVLAHAVKRAEDFAA